MNFRLFSSIALSILISSGHAYGAQKEPLIICPHMSPFTKINFLFKSDDEQLSEECKDDLNTGKLIKLFDSNAIIGIKPFLSSLQKISYKKINHSDEKCRFSTIDANPQNQTLIVAEFDGFLSICDLNTRTFIAKINAHNNAILGVKVSRFNSDKSLIMTKTKTEVGIWSQNLEEITRFENLEWPVSCCWISPDTIAIGSGNKVTVHNIYTKDAITQTQLGGLVTCVECFGEKKIGVSTLVSSEEPNSVIVRMIDPETSKEASCGMPKFASDCIALKYLPTKQLIIGCCHGWAHLDMEAIAQKDSNRSQGVTQESSTAARIFQDQWYDLVDITQYGNECLLFTRFCGHVLMYNYVTKEVLWEKYFGKEDDSACTEISGVTICGNKIIFTTYDSCLYIVDAEEDPSSNHTNS